MSHLWQLPNVICLRRSPGAELSEQRDQGEIETHTGVPPLRLDTAAHGDSICLPEPITENTDQGETEQVFGHGERLFPEQPIINFCRF